MPDFFRQSYLFETITCLLLNKKEAKGLKANCE